MSEIGDAYIKQITDAFDPKKGGWAAIWNHQLEMHIFTGKPQQSEIAFDASRCHRARIYYKSLYEGIPYCSVCHKDLGPNDLVYERIQR